MNALKTLQSKIQRIIHGQDPEYLRRDSLTAENDVDYMLYSPQVVGYNTTSEQQFIFQNLIIGLDPISYSILDIGCGRADLYGFLTEVYGNEIFGYTGIDHNPVMASLANQKYGVTTRSVAFESADLGTHDWVVGSGFFTQRKCETEDADLRKLLVDIQRMYDAANHVVAFNLLSPINTTLHEGFFYVHPGLILDMLIEKYQHVNIRHNYSKDIYTVTIYKF
jgi:SAM-dependent methyltransferase